MHTAAIVAAAAGGVGGTAKDRPGGGTPPPGCRRRENTPTRYLPSDGEDALPLDEEATGDAPETDPAWRVDELPAGEAAGRAESPPVAPAAEQGGPAASLVELLEELVRSGEALPALLRVMGPEGAKQVVHSMLRSPEGARELHACFENWRRQFRGDVVTRDLLSRETYEEKANRLSRELYAAEQRLDDTRERVADLQAALKHGRTELQQSRDYAVKLEVGLHRVANDVARCKLTIGRLQAQVLERHGRIRALEQRLKAAGVVFTPAPSLADIPMPRLTDDQFLKATVGGELRREYEPVVATLRALTERAEQAAAKLAQLREEDDYLLGDPDVLTARRLGQLSDDSSLPGSPASSSYAVTGEEDNGQGGSGEGGGAESDDAAEGGAGTGAAPGSLPMADAADAGEAESPQEFEVEATASGGFVVQHAGKDKGVASADADLTLAIAPTAIAGREGA